jgi:adenylyl-sulfate kinase
MPATSGLVVWLTGVPCAGKSTIAEALTKQLRVDPSVLGGGGLEVLDGDEFRRELCQELGFSREHRDLNVRRLGYVAGLLARNGTTVVVAAVSPYRKARDEVRSRIPRFVEVYVSCPSTVCEARDVKGMYAKARAGGISNFTGVSDPYEPPENPELTIDTSAVPVQDAVTRIIEAMRRR